MEMHIYPNSAIVLIVNFDLMLPRIKLQNLDSGVFLHPFSPSLAAYISMGGVGERAW